MTNRKAKKILDFLARRIGYECVKPHGLSATYVLASCDGRYTHFWYNDHVMVKCTKKYKDFLFTLIDLSICGYPIETCNHQEIIKPHTTLEELEIKFSLNEHANLDLI